MEGILAGAITGISFALFAGQPLNIIGSTGPMLVFERILYISTCLSVSVFPSMVIYWQHAVSEPGGILLFIKGEEF